ncbi:neuroblast differentiation-associated protein AHNAK-like isoform X2 [Poecilia latipinna]|uniref:neuroblast differentiation-associated protein AHNAK-like isoform X2 n=1 Tax=Poecilia latipinna TaxID=48699 RepID=UPI00072D9A04|nr:PREDICTED: neuroblast differentiation-associated protein AHNAK-like isoform X2 [Poecilia latipinna]
MATHRRGRSLSEALTLEESENGALVISSATDSSHNLKEGDEILGATIDFNQLSKQEVINVLKLMEPFDDKVKVLTRSCLSRSVDNLDQCARNPEAMLMDSYTKLYNAKIKRFVKDDSSAAGKAASSKVNLKRDMGLPRLGVDFGLLKSTSLSADADADSKFEVRDLTDGTNLNLPPLGGSLNGPTAGNTLVPRPRLDGRNPQSHLGDYHLSQALPDDLNGITAAGDLKMPNLEKVLDTGLASKGSDVFLPDHDIEVMGPDGISTVPKGKLSLKHAKRLKTPDLNLDDPSGFMESPKLKLSGTLPQMDLGKVNVDTPSGSVQLPNMECPGESLGGDKTIDFNVKTRKIKSGMSASDANLSKVDLKGINLATDTPSASVKSPTGKYKAPKFTMPKFDLPHIQVPDLDVDISGPSGKFKKPNVNMPDLSLSGTLPKGPNLDLNADLKSPDWSLKTPKIKGGINAPDLVLPDMDLKAPKLDINTPDVNIESPKGKFKMPKIKMPKFNFPGFKGPELDGNLNGPDIDVNAPDLNLKAPKADLDLNMPDLSGKFKKPNLTMPDLGLSGPKIDGPNLDMPSGKLNVPKIEGPDWDAKGPSGKLKMPKMNLSGSGPNLDLNADLKSPDFSVKAPKVKGGMNGFEMPDVGFGSPSGNHKKYKMPKVGFSGSKLSGSDLDIPKIKGGLDSPNPSLPNKDFRTSIPDFDVPDVEFGTSPFKLKNMKIPDVGFSSPKLEDPKLDFPSPDFNAKLPKGQNVKLNPDLNSPELNLRAPNMKGGVNSSKLGAPNVNLQAPKLDINTPDGNIGLPGANIKKSQMKMPKGLNANLTSDLNMPNISGDSPKISGPKLRDSDFSLPALDLAEYGINGPKLSAKQRNTRVNGNIGHPDMNFSDPRMKGDLIGARMGMNSSLIDIRSPHLRSPDLNIDNASINFKGVSYKNRRSDMAGMSLKRPDLDIDQDIRLNKKYTKTNVRSSYPTVDQGLHQYIDFNRSDLNIDDFTGRDHVLRARGSQPDLRAQSNHPQWIPSSGVYVDPRNSRRLPDGSRDHSMHGLPQNNLDGSGGYFVSVFPKKALLKSKYNTTSGLGFPTAKMDLDVPDENYLKGSTYFFSNIV